jgi:hypothetical protein
VGISSLALYWQPHEKVIYSEMSSSSTEDRVRDLQFSQRIARANENGGVVKGKRAENRVRYLQFSYRIARANVNGVETHPCIISSKFVIFAGMKYLLGPVSINAEMAWCPEPKKINFQKSLIDLSIKMQVNSISKSLFLFISFFTFLVHI